MGYVQLMAEEENPRRILNVRPEGRQIRKTKDTGQTGMEARTHGGL